jgi:yecA family protein
MLNADTQVLEFEDVSKLLLNRQPGPKPSEVHGIVCGLVCAGADLDGKVWIERIIGQMSEDVWLEGPALLVQLYDQISRQFSGVEFKFQMLLPDVSHSLADRTLALTEWCQGFLSGLHTAGVDFSEVLTDILCRFSELAQMQRAQIETTDEKILTFVELTEYIRKSVWALYTARTYSMKTSALKKKALH